MLYTNQALRHAPVRRTSARDFVLKGTFILMVVTSAWAVLYLTVLH